jgi:hypothetical protein
MVENFPNKKYFLKLSSFPLPKGDTKKILLLFIYLFISPHLHENLHKNIGWNLDLWKIRKITLFATGNRPLTKGLYEYL